MSIALGHQTAIAHASQFCQHIGVLLQARRINQRAARPSRDALHQKALDRSAVAAVG
jgi:hypothetical protein